jgi:Tfp pilus assembly protein PilV
MRVPRPGAAARGVSLVEAIVAMAVMAFGMMAIVGLQATLRLNSDVAKQRSEAVRIAQEAIEDWRAFTSMPSEAGEVAYADIDTLADVAVAGYTTNTAYTLTRSVSSAFGDSLKSIQVVVSWTDRNGQLQRVELDSIIARVDPALAGTLSQEPAGKPTLQPLGRSPSVPPAAVDLGGGKSAYQPPGAPDNKVWVFDNLSGVITSVCTFPGTDLSQLVVGDNCSVQPSWPITGFVRFSFGTAPDATTPLGEQVDLGIYALAIGVAFADGECYVAPVQDPKLTYTSYACRVPQSADTTWTGTTLLAAPLDLTLYDVCRYSNGQPGNQNHPQVYVGVDRPLTNQNFLIVDEGVACPTGTLPHQPPPSTP